MTTISQQYEAGLFATLAYANYADVVAIADTKVRKDALVARISEVKTQAGQC